MTTHASTATIYALDSLSFVFARTNAAAYCARVFQPAMVVAKSIWSAYSATIAIFTMVTPVFCIVYAKCAFGWHRSMSARWFHFVILLITNV